MFKTASDKLAENIIKNAALRLYNYLYNQHWNGHALKGPDPGVRFNARIWRFPKSYLRFLPWSDDLVYAQAQKYWIHDNWLMSDLDPDNAYKYREIAIACSDYLLTVQQTEGYWEYPNPEWKGRIATIEGNYAAIGMLETYNRTGKPELLEAAKKWYEFAVNRIGYQEKNGMLAINYFCDRGNSMIPNNSASALCVFAILARAADDAQYLETCGGMVSWLNDVQLDTGELPYGIAGPGEKSASDRIHFLCYQYNAFQFLNLADYYCLTQDEQIIPVLKKLANFIASGIASNGNLWYDCRHEYPEVTYYSTAAGAALHLATEMGFGDYQAISVTAYNRVLAAMKPDGRITYYSRRNYRFLNDRRPYPRYLSMILNHLLLRYQTATKKKL
ncbi:glycoside hydrolase family 76 protein [Acidobacteriota bacterium]